ncbi:MAG: RNase P subunit p30 family protein [archaeon]
MATDIVLFKEKGLDFGYEKTITAKLVKLRDAKAKTSELLIVEARDIDEARKAAENKNVDVMVGVESSGRRDKMQFRNSGLNQVICKLCKANNTAIAIPIAEIINSPKRNALLGRVMQNIKFCRKYKVRMVAASFAKNTLEQRTSKDVESFLKTLGMTPAESVAAMNNVEIILKEKKETVRKGVKIKS